MVWDISEGDPTFKTLNLPSMVGVLAAKGGTIGLGSEKQVIIWNTLTGATRSIPVDLGKVTVCHISSVPICP